jgi:peroxiredoxin
MKELIEMSLTPSTMLPLGVKAPDFRLPDTSGRMVSLNDFNNPAAYLVIFMCNHCPYVIHVKSAVASLTAEYIQKNVAIVGINSNDANNYPADSPEKMVAEANTAGYKFPYLYDETQEVAKAYHAACTPDFFLFDKEKKLAYRGQMDSSRPGNSVPVTGADLRKALDAVMGGGAVSGGQKPSMGCNIKWKAGNEPEYFKL